MGFGFFKKMNLGIDLRGLNYSPRTGVNTFTLHFLYHLAILNQTNPALRLTSIGLRKARFLELCQEFPWLANLFESHLSLAEYLNLPTWLIKFSFIGQQTFFLNGLLSIYNILFRSIYSKQVKNFDLLFMPQPKPFVTCPNTKLAIMIHDVYGALDSRMLPFLESLKEGKMIYSRLLKSADQIWVNSISTGNDLVRFFKTDKSKIHLVYPALPIWDVLRGQNLEAKTNLKSKQDFRPKPYFLALSGIEPRKNWHNLLLAHAALQKTEPTYQLELILSGTPISPKYQNYLQNIIRKYNIQRVSWIISPDEKEKQNLLAGCKFLAYPSFYEGFGFPILEAFKYGKSVLTGNISSMPEIAKESGLYVNPFNYMDIARGIWILDQDGEFRNSLESKTSHTLELYSWDQMQKAIDERIINSVPQT